MVRGPWIKTFWSYAEESVMALFRSQPSKQSAQRLGERNVMPWWMAVFALYSPYKFSSCYIINHDKLGLCCWYRLIISSFHSPLCCISCTFHVLRVQCLTCSPVPPNLDYPFCPSLDQSGHTEQHLLRLIVCVTSSRLVTDWNNSSAKIRWPACGLCSMIWKWKHSPEAHVSVHTRRQLESYLKGLSNKTNAQFVCFLFVCLFRNVSLRVSSKMAGPQMRLFIIYQIYKKCLWDTHSLLPLNPHL